MTSVISESSLSMPDHNTYAQLHSIRISSIAQQPAATDMTYIGLATLVPVELRALCTCAGLFFARVYGQGAGNGEQEYYLEIAALSHYFDADAPTHQKHVRMMMLSASQFALLVEYDRQLAGMPTCDVRELVTDHVAAHRLVHGSHLHAACHPSSPRPSVTHPTIFSAGASSQPPTPRQEAVVPTVPKRSQESALLWCEGPTVTVQLDTLRIAANAEAFHESAHLAAQGPVPFAILLLRAALDLLTAQWQQETDQRARELLTRHLCEVRRVLVARREIPPKVGVTPLYQPGKAREPIGCTVHIGVPLQFAA